MIKGFTDVDVVGASLHEDPADDIKKKYSALKSTALLNPKKYIQLRRIFRTESIPL